MYYIYKSGSNNNDNYKYYYCDKVEDLDKLPTNLNIGEIQNNDTLSHSKCSIGSKAFCLENSTLYILNTKNTWVKYGYKNISNAVKNNENNKYEINVENGSSYVNVIVSQDSLISIKAQDKANEYFKHWMLDDGQILSTRKELKCYIKDNFKIHAKYTNDITKAVTKPCITVLSYRRGIKPEETQKDIAYLSLFYDIPSVNGVPITSGFLRTYNEELNDENLLVLNTGNADIKINEYTNLNSSAGNMGGYVTISGYKALNNIPMYARAYLRYIDSESSEECIIYSKIFKVMK